MPKVFVTQVPLKRDPVTQAKVPVFNVAPASEHGELDVMMPPAAAFFNTDELVRQLSLKLFDYDYARGDSLMLLGDSAVIAATVAIVAHRAKRFAILRWDRNIGRYLRVSMTV